MAIAMRSNGNLNVALKEAREQNGELFDRFRNWMRICFKKDVLAAIDFVDETHRSGKEGQKALLRYGLHICRQCMVLEHQLDGLVLSSGLEKKFITDLAPYLKSEKADEVQQELNLAFIHLERNANAKILFMDLTFTLFKLIGK
jgi:DNA polymerase-3 subunit delta'